MIVEKKRVLVVFLAALLALSLGLGAQGGALGRPGSRWALGDDVDYDSGSSWDSGSDWDSGSSWDSSSWDSGSSWDDDDDDSYHSGSVSGGGGGGGGGGSRPSRGTRLVWGLTGLFFDFGVMLLIAWLIYRFVKRFKGNATQSATRAAGGRQRDGASVLRLKERDPAFSEADIEAKVKNWVMMFENAWCDGDMTPCRPFLSDGLYNSYQKQLGMLKQNGEKTCSEDLAVLNCNIDRWRQDGDREYLDVYLRVKKRTYKVAADDHSRVVKGYRDTTYHLDYIWQLMRSAGGQTQNAGLRVEECPNCGAQTSLNQSGKCAYCNSTLVARDFDWVLNKVDKLAQKSYK